MKNLLLLILIISASCSKQQQTEIYTVKAGYHHSDNRGVVLVDDNISFIFEVNNTWYWGEGLELSKVYGLNWGNPQKNSIRLATRSMGYYVKLYMFCHSDKEITIIEVGEVSNGEYYCSLGYDGDYWMYFDGKTYRVDAPELKNAFLSFPYIGGNYTIEHDWKLKITTQ